MRRPEESSLFVKQFFVVVARDAARGEGRVFVVALLRRCGAFTSVARCTVARVIADVGLRGVQNSRGPLAQARAPVTQRARTPSPREWSPESGATSAHTFTHEVTVKEPNLSMAALSPLMPSGRAAVARRPDAPDS